MPASAGCIAEARNCICVIVCLHELIGVAEAIFMKNTSYFTFCVTVSLCPVWHSSVTAAQTKALESLQRRAMRIIFQDSDYNYDVADHSRTRHAGVTA